MTKPWWQQPMMPFDLESTGVSVHTDRIVTGYVATLLPGAETWTVRVDTKVLVDPGVEIPAGATAVHGITTAMAKEHGADPAEGVNSIAEAIAQGLKAGFPVVGYNLAYDLSMLYWECRRLDLPTVAERLGAGATVAPVVDAHVLDKAVDKYRKGSRKLDATCAYWGVRFDGAHDAGYDALAASRLAYRLAARHPVEIGNVPLHMLHERQASWRREQCASLREYFIKQGRPSHVDPCWPECVNRDHVPPSE